MKHFPILYDGVIKWKHFPRYWPFVRGIHQSPVNSPHKGQWRGILMFSLMYVWINGCINNREAGDLRRYHGHYDVIVMYDGWNYVNTWYGVIFNHNVTCIPIPITPCLIFTHNYKLECGTWYHHPRRLQCVMGRNLRIFKVATWHYRCRHHLKNNCIWDYLQCCLLFCS